MNPTFPIRARAHFFLQTHPRRYLDYITIVVYIIQIQLATSLLGRPHAAPDRAPGLVSYTDKDSTYQRQFRLSHIVHQPTSMRNHLARP